MTAASVGKGWLITGASRGFGRQWALAALERGDRVVLGARDADSVNDVIEAYPSTALAVRLDVTSRSDIEAAVSRSKDFLGGIDVLVNNAGYGLFGMIEEISEQQARDQFETNVFGALWMTQAVLPAMRAHGGGHVIQVSSIGGVQAFPGLGIYNASKWALEGFSQALAREVAGMGIKVTIVEPTAYATDWAFSSAVRVDENPAYDSVREALVAARARLVNDRGDPSATSSAILAIADMDEPPLRLFLGDGPHEVIRAEYAARLAEWDRYEDLSKSVHR